MISSHTILFDQFNSSSLGNDRGNELLGLELLSNDLGYGVNSQLVQLFLHTYKQISNYLLISPKPQTKYELLKLIFKALPMNELKRFII